MRNKNRKLNCLVFSLVLTITSVSVIAQLPDLQRDAVTKSIKKSTQQFSEFCRHFETESTFMKQVKTSAILYVPPKGVLRVDGESDEILFSKNCNSPDSFAIVDFLPTKNFNAIQPKIKQAEETDLPRLFSITFEGRMQSELYPAFGHLGWLRNKVNIQRVLAFKELDSKNVMPKFDAPAPLLELGNSLQSLNTEFVLSFFGRGFNRQNLDALLSEDTHITINGKRTSIDEFLSMAEKKNSGNLSMPLGNISRTTGTWRVVGTILRKSGDGSKVRFGYNIQYRKGVDKNWKPVFVKVWNQ